MDRVAKSLPGSAGLDGIDSLSTSDILPKYGRMSSELRRSLAKFVMLMSNSYLLWVALMYLILGRTIGMNKCPGVRPIVISGVLRHFKYKVLLLVIGAEPSCSCGSDQL